MEAAGEALYRKYFRPLYRFFRAKVPDDYEDLIQTTMLECVRSRDRFRGDAPFRAFLFGVARHRHRIARPYATPTSAARFSSRRRRL